MGWEARVFFRPKGTATPFASSAADTVDIPKEPRFFNLARKSAVERRCDIYTPYSPSAGVKTRSIADPHAADAAEELLLSIPPPYLGEDSSTLYELKTRYKVKPDGFEKWEKDLREVTFAYVLQKLDVEGIIRTVSNEVATDVYVPVRKLRRKIHIGMGVWCEYTDIYSFVCQKLAPPPAAVTESTVPAQVPAHNILAAEHWVTMSLEGHHKDLELDFKELIEECITHHASGGQVLVMGYPEFVLHMVSSVGASPKADAQSS
eukprot:m.503781 g.503781  ORF g.503781 m.503781 type:complete len:262 (-) comp21853_c0_seq12:2089-2874(-)